MSNFSTLVANAAQSKSCSESLFPSRGSISSNEERYEAAGGLIRISPPSPFLSYFDPGLALLGVSRRKITIVGTQDQRLYVLDRQSGEIAYLDKEGVELAGGMNWEKIREIQHVPAQQRDDDCMPNSVANALTALYDKKLIDESFEALIKDRPRLLAALSIDLRPVGRANMGFIERLNTPTQSKMATIVFRRFGLSSVRTGSIRQLRKHLATGGFAIITGGSGT